MKFIVWNLRNDHTLVTLLSLHKVVGIVCNSKNVRWLFSYALVGIAIDVLLVVDGKNFIRIESHKDGPSVSLQQKKKTPTYHFMTLNTRRPKQYKCMRA